MHYTPANIQHVLPSVVADDSECRRACNLTEEVSDPVNAEAKLRVFLSLFLTVLAVLVLRSVIGP